MNFKFYDMTYENQLAYSLFTNLRSKNIPLRLAFLIILHTTLIFLSIILFFYNDYDVLMLFLGLADAVSFSYHLYKVDLRDPNLIIKRNQAIINHPREYIFNDDEFTVQRTDSSDHFSEQFTFNYSQIKAVRDTKEYIFIEIEGRLGSLFFAKSIFSDQKLLELKTFLQKRVGKRYLTYWKVSTCKK